MPYLNEDSLGKLLGSDIPRSAFATASDFRDQSDRTLTLGKSESGAFSHTFIKDGELIVHRYLELPAGTHVTVYWTAGKVPVEELSPSDYVLPSATDSQFAYFMQYRGIPLRFLRWNNPLHLSFLESDVKCSKMYLGRDRKRSLTK